MLLSTALLRPLTWLLPGLLLAGSSEAAPPKPAPRPTVILFVGNSFFHGHTKQVLKYNTAGITDENFGLPARSPRHEQDGPWGGIPAIFQKLTQQAGLPYEVHLEAISGQTLQFHYDSALAVIDRPWDAVVLQEHSMGALPTRRGGQPERFRQYATRLEQTAHARNPQARVYLYQTWARADQVYPAGKPYQGLPVDSMFADTHRGYYDLARQNGRFAGVAPVGDAWLRAIRQGVAVRNPYQPEAGKIDLWGHDQFHSSPAGSYLNALVLFAEITGKNPRKLGPREQAAADLGLSPSAAAQLQRVAYEQVRAARKARHRAPKGT